MDDTSRRVGGPDDLRGRTTDDLTARSAESMRGYSTSEAPPAEADTERRTTEIRRDIEQTREEMSETIEAIQQKLRPGNIVSGATDRVRNATTERVRHMRHSAENAANRMMSRSGSGSGGFMEEIRQHPIPAALLGVGAAWLFMNSRSRGDYEGRSRRTLHSAGTRGVSFSGISGPEDLRTADMDYDTDIDYYEGTYPAEAGYGRYGEHTHGGFMDRIQHNPIPAALTAVGIGWLAMSNMRGERGYAEADAYTRRVRHYPDESADSSESTTSQLRDTVSNATSNIAESARSLTSRAQEYTRGATGQARYRGRRTQSELQRMTRENPLMVGAGALLLGAAVGLAIPETERENELLGETRDSMLDRGKEMARNAASRAQDTAADLAGEAASRIVTGKQE